MKFRKNDIQAALEAVQRARQEVLNAEADCNAIMERQRIAEEVYAQAVAELDMAFRANNLGVSVYRQRDVENVTVFVPDPFHDQRS